MVVTGGGASGVDPGPVTARVTLFGPMTLTLAGRELVVRGPVRRSLVALLAMEPGEHVAADRLIDALWPEGTTGDPARSLRVQVSQLRAALDELVPGGRFLLEGRYPRYRFTAAVRTDVSEARDHQRRAYDLMARDPVRAREELRRALATLEGAPLPDLAGRAVGAELARQLERFREGIALSLEDVGGVAPPGSGAVAPAEVPPELAAHLPDLLVGRQVALDTIVEAYRATASDPWPQVVEVVGVGGVGKTSLLAAAAARLATRGAPVRYASWLPTPFATLDPLWRAGLLPRSDGPTPASRSMSHLELAERMLTALAEVGGDAAPVVVLDDLHWLPLGLESAIETLLAKHRGGALFLLAHRPEPRGGQLDRLVPPGAHRIVLEPFTPEELAELAAAGGSDGPAASGAGAPWVAAALLAPERPGRFDRLAGELAAYDPAARRLVDRLAFHPEGLTLAVCHHGAEGSAASVLQRLRGLIADGLVVEIDTDPVRFALVHELVARRVMEELAPARRMEVQADLHAALAAAGEPVTVRVHHALGAAPLVGPAAGETVVAAVRDLVAQGAHADAVALAEEARRRSVPLPVGQRCVLEAAEAYGRVGVAGTSADVPDRLLALATAAADVDDWESMAVVIEYRQLLGRSDVIDQRELALLQRGLAAVGDGVPRLRFALLGSSLYDAMYGGREPAEVAGTPDEMLAIAEDLRDPLLRAVAMAAQHWLLSATAGPLAAIRERSDALLALAATSNDATIWSRAHGAAIGTALDAHDLTAVREHVAALRANADPLGRWQAALARVCLLTDDGRLDEAEAAIGQAAEEATRRGVQHRGEALTAQRFVIAWARGELAGWRSLVEVVDWTEPSNLIYGMARAAAQLQDGDLAGAAALGREVAGRCLEVSGWYSPVIGAVLAEVAAFAEDAALAGLARRLLERWAGRRVFVGAATFDLGPADHYLGLTHATEGDADRAAVLRERAAAAAACVLWQARIERVGHHRPRLAAPGVGPWSWIG